MADTPIPGHNAHDCRDARMTLDARPARTDPHDIAACYAEADQAPSHAPKLPSSAPTAAPDATGVFTTGSIMRHVLVMTATGSVGLISVFFVDFLTLLYISRLGDTNLTAAVGYASQLTFLIISVSIGLSVAIGALVSQAFGAGDPVRARRIATSGLVHSTVIAGTLGLVAIPFTREILTLFGARGETLDVGTVYLRIVLPAMIFLGVGMACSSILRGIGDARRAMYVTLGGAVVTICLDPIFIFVFHLGIYGAGIVLVLSRFSLLLVGLHGAVKVHKLVEWPRPAVVWRDIAPVFHIAGPAVLTNLASPASNIFVTHVFSRFGGEVIAAYAIMDRVTPVAFGVLFALSSSVGPIIGQNYGAHRFGRIQQTLTRSLLLSACYVVIVALALWFGAPLVVAAFGARDATGDLLAFFCHAGGVMWFFLGGIFVANAAFNNLDRPVLSAVFNWGRATLGTMPFVLIGAAHAGPRGGYLGMVAGSALFGCFAVVAAYLVVNRTARRPAPASST